MDLGIAGRPALVLGASRGIGAGIARALHREGARVVVTSRSRERADQAADALGEGVVGLAADTDDVNTMPTLVSVAAEALGGPIEILILNTGGPPPGTALAHGRDEWGAAYRSLVLAPHALAEAALPGMRERGFGRIVSVGSTSTLEPIPSLGLSNSHRSATVGFLKTLSREVAADGVTVNTVASGRFATERQADASGSLDAAEALARSEVPAGRLGSPEEYGDLVAFLCSERAAYLTGTVIPLDGGMVRGV